MREDSFHRRLAENGRDILDSETAAVFFNCSFFLVIEVDYLPVPADQSGLLTGKILSGRSLCAVLILSAQN